MVVGARLDRPALSQWCPERLGGEPEQVLFEAGYLSQVIGLRLTNGRDVVVKVRAWLERLIGCGQVQHSLSVAGFPAPRLLVPPERLGRLGVSAEALIDGGALLAAERDSAARFAEVLALLVRIAPDPATVSTLAPSPAWVGRDHAAEKLWPAPDDRESDLNGHPGDRWLDEIDRSRLPSSVGSRTVDPHVRRQEGQPRGGGSRHRTHKDRSQGTGTARRTVTARVSSRRLGRNQTMSGLTRVKGPRR